MHTGLAIFLLLQLVIIPLHIANLIVMLLVFLVDLLLRSLLGCCIRDPPWPLRRWAPALYKLSMSIMMILANYQLWATGAPPKNMTRAQCRSGAVFAGEWLRKYLCLEYGRAVPLTVRPRSAAEVDIVVPDDCVLLEGGVPPTRLRVGGLRQSIDAAVRADLTSGRFGDALAKEDEAAPRYFVHGWHEALDLDDPALELWCTSTATLFWSAVYSLSRGAPASSPAASRTPHRLRATRRAPRSRCDLGRRRRRARGARVRLPAARRQRRLLRSGGRSGGAPLCRPMTERRFRATQLSDPELREKVAVRRHYVIPALSEAPELDGRHDAYVFTREAVRAADLRVVRTYRLVNPAATKRASSEPALKRSGSSQRAVGAAGSALMATAYETLDASHPSAILARRRRALNGATKILRRAILGLLAQSSLKKWPPRSSPSSSRSRGRSRRARGSRKFRRPAARRSSRSRRRPPSRCRPTRTTRCSR